MSQTASSIQEARRIVGMTQRQLADALCCAESSVASYESGVRSPRNSRVRLMVRVFKEMGVSISAEAIRGDFGGIE
ncbi:helix-turn-helix domain-containing protein [Carnimonas bestiolae]|uniref:helix-turn-helix domain-containing protein n=1 Tax=Carnimonas bestiolae TaxID=3402172 RepID=UPI003EDC5FD8